MGIPASEWDQELSYWVEWMVAQRQILTNWQGRLEGLIARHWPEATRVLKLTSVTLLRALGALRDPKAWRRTRKLRSSWAAGVGYSWHRRKSSDWWPRRVRAWVCGLGNGSGARSKNYARQAWRHGKRPNVRNGGCASLAVGT